VASSIRAAAATGLPLYLQGDFNAHCPEWGDASARSSRFAKPFIELFEELSLDVLNPLFPEAAEVATFPRLGTVIDLAVSSHAHAVRRCAVLPIAVTGFHTDHSSLLLSIDCSDGGELPAQHDGLAEEARHSFNVRKADWPFFSELCARFLAEPVAANSLSALSACPAAVESIGACSCASTAAASAALESAWQAVHGALLDAALLAIPQRRLCRYSKSWWNYPDGDLPGTYHAYRTALRNQQRRPVCLALRERCRREWRLMCEKARRWQHEQRCASLQHDPRGALKWKVWQRLTGRKSTAAALHSIVSPANGTLPTSPQEAADNIAEHFRLTCHLPAVPLGRARAEWLHPDLDESEEEERKSVDAALPDELSEAASHQRQVLRWLAAEGDRTAADRAVDPAAHSLFTAETLSSHLQALPDKAVGGDAISTLFLQKGGESLLNALLLLFNFSWAHGCVPDAWRCAEVLPLYKGKGAQADANNYRPISLTSCVARCLEGLIHARLYPLSERLGMLSERQFGFRTGRGTQDALFSLTEWIKLRLNHKGGAVVAFLDLIKAYDRTWIEGVLYRLAHGPEDGAYAGIKGRAWGWIRAFLTGRRFRVRAGQLRSVWKLCTAGVPQGAVLSPLLFAIFLDPLLRALQRDEFLLPLAAEKHLPNAGLHRAVHSQLFADDGTIGVDTRCFGWQAAFQRALNIAHDFATRWRLAFSTAAGKSAIVHFRLRGNAGYAGAPFLLGGGALLREERYKFLGVVLHEHLDWTPHFDYLLRRARFASFQVQGIVPCLLRAPASGRAAAAGCAAVHSRRPQGPHFSAVRALVIGAIYAVASYGIQFMDGAGGALEAMLLRLQSHAVRPLRAALALPGTAHSLSVLVEANIPPLSIFRQQLLLSFARRCMLASADHPSRRLLEQSRCTLAEVGARKWYRNVQGNFGSHPQRSVASNLRKPLVYSILEAEQRFGIHVLPPSERQPPLQAPLPTAKGLTALQIEERHAFQPIPAARAQQVPAAAPPIPVVMPSPPLYSFPAAAGDIAIFGGGEWSSFSALSRRIAFNEWQQLPIGGAILRSVKFGPACSFFLYEEPRARAVLRTRLRFDRASLAKSLHKRALADSPLCPLCASGAEQTVEHALLRCAFPPLATARAVCLDQLQQLGSYALDLQLLLEGWSAAPPPRNAAKAARPSVQACAAAAAAAGGGVAAAAEALITAPRQPVHFPTAVAAAAPAADGAAAAAERKARLAHRRRATLAVTSTYLQVLQEVNGGIL